MVLSVFLVVTIADQDDESIYCLTTNQRIFRLEACHPYIKVQTLYLSVISLRVIDIEVCFDIEVEISSAVTSSRSQLSGFSWENMNKQVYTEIWLTAMVTDA